MKRRIVFFSLEIYMGNKKQKTSNRKQTNKRIIILNNYNYNDIIKKQHLTTKRFAKKNKITQKRKQIVIHKEKIDLFFTERLRENNLKIHRESIEMSRLNETFIELMEKLADIMTRQGEPFRARAYQKAQETIMAYPTDILSPSDLKGKSGIGETIMDKLNEYVKTGTLNILEREKNNPINILTQVYGIGPKKAKDLVENGITTIDSLRENIDSLNDVQRVGLQYYEDILKRIPRSEIEDYKTVFEQAFPKHDSGKMEIVGSYRRGAQNSGDIDVIITSSNPRVFTTFVDNLISQNIILNVLSRGPTKCLVVTKLNENCTARRVDFLYTTPQEFPFAILYFTGSKIFNTVMRHIALEKGYTMNEHGIYKMDAKKKGDKVEHVFTSEEDIFDFLGLEYKAPTERTDGRAVIIKNQKAGTKNKQKPPLIIIEDDDDEHVNDGINHKSEEPALKMPAKPVLNTVKKNNKTKPQPKIHENKSKKIMIVGADFEDIYTPMAEEFKKTGITFLDTLNEKQLNEFLREANRRYYNSDAILSDSQYDIVKEYVESKYPSSLVLKEVGAPVERNKVELPYFMGSMDKIKPDSDALTLWKSKFPGPYVISAKADGVSGLNVTHKGHQTTTEVSYSLEDNTAKLYTRGDGKIGQDISHLIPYLRLPKTANLVIRGEFIVPRGLFEAKYKDKFANPRNMVAGIINSKSISPYIRDVYFIAYEVIKPESLKASEQLELLSKLDVETIIHKKVNDITNESLSELLMNWRYNYAFEIDGIIVSSDHVYERKNGNPAHSFAFKMVLTEQMAEAKVVDVIWNASKDGYLKPRVQIEPINLGGVEITYATGFNGAFIKNNNIGVGAVIELIRSGDVIPHIVNVIMPADHAKMPAVPYKWNETKIDIMLEDIESDETVREKNITGFFKGIGVEGLSIGNIKRIMEAGYKTVPEILKMEFEDFMKVDGFKEKTSLKLYNGIKSKLSTTTLLTIMSASNIFGRGFSDKKIELILEDYPNVLISNDSNAAKIEKISNIKGMATKTAEAFVEKIPQFIEFMYEAGLSDKLAVIAVEKKPANTSHELFGKSIIITGFRDNSLQEKLTEVGAKIGSVVSSKTFAVLVKNKDEDTGKANNARQLGIPLMTPEELTSKYSL